MAGMAVLLLPVLVSVFLVVRDPVMLLVLLVWRHPWRLLLKRLAIVAAPLPHNRCRVLCLCKVLVPIQSVPKLLLLLLSHRRNQLRPNCPGNVILGGGLSSFILRSSSIILLGICLQYLPSVCFSRQLAPQSGVGFASQQLHTTSGSSSQHT